MASVQRRILRNILRRKKKLTRIVEFPRRQQQYRYSQVKEAVREVEPKKNWLKRLWEVIKGWWSHENNRS